MVLSSLCFSREKNISKFDDNHNIYVNPRFEFRVVFPKTLIPQSPPANDDGRVFESEQKDFILTVWGSNNALSETLKAKFRSAIAEYKTGNIRYKACRSDRYVISGIRNDKIFYAKSVYVSEENRFINLLIEYNVSAKKKYNKIALAVSKSFREVTHPERKK